MASENTSANGALTPATNLFGLGAELLRQVEQTIGSQRISALRLKLGNRVIKEIPIASASAVITVVLALLAVLISTLSIEVEHEPATSAA